VAEPDQGEPDGQEGFHGGSARGGCQGGPVDLGQGHADQQEDRFPGAGLERLPEG